MYAVKIFNNFNGKNWCKVDNLDQLNYYDSVIGNCGSSYSLHFQKKKKKDSIFISKTIVLKQLTTCG